MTTTLTSMEAMPSRQIEEQQLAAYRTRAREGDGCFSADRRSVAFLERLAVQRDVAPRAVHPSVAPGRDRLFNPLSLSQHRCVDPCILLNYGRGFAAILARWSGDKPQTAVFFQGIVGELL